MTLLIGGERFLCAPDAIASGAKRTPTYLLLQEARWRLDVFQNVRLGWAPPIPKHRAAFMRATVRELLREAHRRGVNLREAFAC